MKTAMHLRGLCADTMPLVLKYVSGQCIGGCDVVGPPLSMSGNSVPNANSDMIDIPKAKSDSSAYKASLESLDQLPFDQVRAAKCTGDLTCARST